RHAGDAAGDVAAVADRRAAGYDADTAVGGYVLERIGVLIVKAELIVDREIFQAPQSEAEQDALLDPEVDTPLVCALFGSADLAGVQLLFEFVKEREMLGGEFSRGMVEELLYAVGK